MRRQRIMSQVKEQDKTSKKDINEMEISSPLCKVFKAMVIKMLTKLNRRMKEHSEILNKEIENIKFPTEVTELRNITELKNTLEEFNSRLDEPEDQINKLEDKAIELTQSSKTTKEFLKMKINSLWG